MHIKGILHRGISFLTSMVILTSNLVYPVYADEGTDSDKEKATAWLSCTISQHDCGRDVGCTGCSTMMILQNSRLLDSEWQFGEPGERVLINNRSFTNDAGKTINQFAEACDTVSTTPDRYGNISWAWVNGSGINATDLSKWTGGKLKPLTASSDKSVESDNVSYNEDYVLECIVGLGGKDFKNMNHEELVAAFNILWDAGLFIIICGGHDSNNGRGAYMAKHASIVGGVSETEIYVADVWDGLIKAQPTWQEGYVVYTLCYYSEETSPVELNGGSRGHSMVMSEDKDGRMVLEGFMDEDGFITSARVEECNITLAAYESLSQDDKTAVRGWTQDLDAKREMQKYSWIRSLVSLLGVFVCIYSVLLYVAYQFDRVNNFVDISLLSVLSFGRLMVSPDEKTSTFGTGAIEKHGTFTVKHKDIIKVTIIGEVIGVLIVSGAIYRILLWVITLVRSRGGTK